MNKLTFRKVAGETVASAIQLAVLPISLPLYVGIAIGTGSDPEEYLEITKYCPSRWIGMKIAGEN